MKSDEPIPGLNAKVHRNTRFGTVERVYSITDRITGKVPRVVARSFLRRHAEALGLDPGLKDLKFDSVRKSIFGKHVLWQQRRSGKPISGAWVRVDISPRGRLVAVQNNAVPRVETLRIAKVMATWRAKGISRTRAERIALAAVKAKKKAVRSAEESWRQVGKTTYETWKVIVRSEQPVMLWRIYIDTRSGRVVEKKDMIAAARGRVFDPSPPASLDDPTMDPGHMDMPGRAYRQVKLQGLNGSGHLEGEHVIVRTLGRRVKRTDGEFMFHRGDAQFREVMAYYHIDRAARHLHALGFKDIFTKPIRAYVDGTDEDNSWYDPETRNKWLVFGTGGAVCDAEDAEVIVHEYAHAIQDAQVPGWGDSKESKAMGEGFGDFLAGSLFFRKKPERFRNWVFAWDYMGESRGRSLVKKLEYPKDFVNRVDMEHSNGQIWSACLWQLRELVGPRRAERIVIASHYLCTRSSSFKDAAHRILEANERLYKDEDRTAIRTLFEERGIIEPK